MGHRGCDLGCSPRMLDTKVGASDGMAGRPAWPRGVPASERQYAHDNEAVTPLEGASAAFDAPVPTGMVRHEPHRATKRPDRRKRFRSRLSGSRSQCRPPVVAQRGGARVRAGDGRVCWKEGLGAMANFGPRRRFPRRKFRPGMRVDVSELRVTRIHKDTSARRHRDSRVTRTRPA